MEQRVQQARTLHGVITPPGDKSISHRALMLNGIAAGQAKISNFLVAADCLSTLACMRQLGVTIDIDGSDVTINGVGGKGPSKPDRILDAGNSGTTMRLLTGLLSAQKFQSVITGDLSLRSRPMDRIIQPLNLMGARIQGENGGPRAPLTIDEGELCGIEYLLPVASAQIKSAVLLAALFARGDTIIEEPAPSRDHTERMMQAMGVHITSSGLFIRISPISSPLNPLSIQIPADISSAAFWMIVGAIHPNARIKVLDTCVNPTRTGIINVLRSMGAKLHIEKERTVGSEPVADIICQSGSLRGGNISGDIIPLVIDEIPVIAVAAAVAQGATTIRDAQELRVKEVDRISTTVKELSKFGVRIEELPDGMIIHGETQMKGAICQSHGDHRLAMALGIAGLISEGETVISGADAVNISYPGFWEELFRISECN